VLYVEELIGPNTVNTVPPATLDAFRDHGTPRDSLEENVEDARHVLAELEKSGISLDAITAELVQDGVKLFADAADKLYGAVAHKRATVLGAGIDRQVMALGGGIGKAVEQATEEWRASARIRRLWQHDRSVWTGSDEHKWLGWLNSPAAADIADYEDYGLSLIHISIGFGQFAHSIRRAVNMTYIVENNGVYGLTKGQFSATADRGSKSKKGVTNTDNAIDLVAIALQLGATFVARSFSGDKSQLVPLISAACLLYTSRCV